MRLTDLYSEYFANWVSGGNLITRDRISLLGMKPLYDRFLTNGYITKVWCITGFPVYCKSNVTQAIRQEMFKLCPKVRTVVHTYSLPVDVQVTSEVFKRQLKRAAGNYSEYRDVFDNMREDEQLLGNTITSPDGKKVYISADRLNSIKMLSNSYTYVYEQATSAKTFSNTYFFIQASAESKKDLHTYRKQITTLLEGAELQFMELKGSMGQYLSNFCPGSYVQDGVKKVESMLFSQENLATQLPYKTKGLVGGQGILMGLNWQNKLPFSLDILTSGAAQVIMWLGKSGCGKTVSAFHAAMQLVGKGVHCSVIDIKGAEWSKVAKYVKALEISMGSSSSRFVNTMRLDDLGCTLSDCEEAFNMALSNTVGLFSLMVNLGSNEGNPTDLETILEQAVMKVYNSREVIANNPNTFHRTKDMRYAEVLEVMDSLMATQSFTDDQKKLCTLIRTRCSTYFGSEGRHSDAFKNEITVAEVLDTPLVIYSFNKNTGTMLDTLDTIRVFMVQVLDGRKTTLRKRKKLHTAAFYEELQRCEQFGKMITYISHRVTGSRSDNLSIFLLLNAVSTFDSSQLAAIKSNITTKIIGRVEDNDIPILVKDFGCGEIEGYIQMLNGVDSENWRNCFAVQYDVGNDTDKVIYKTVLPNYMLQEFKTRDDYAVT